MGVMLRSIRFSEVHNRAKFPYSQKSDLIQSGSSLRRPNKMMKLVKGGFAKKKYLILHLDYIMHLRILPKAGALELHSVYYITFLKLGKELLSILLKLSF